MFWLAIFGIGGRTEGFSDLAKLLYSEAENFRILAGLVVALPIGVLIHQLSVLIKNWVVGKCCKYFSDYPQRIDFSDNSELKKYCLDKISNLNSFYYVRVDNGLLAPLIAWFFISVLIGLEVAWYLIGTSFVIGFLTVIYIPRIHCEIKFFREIIADIDEVSE
jgi:hypothetical protein